jgi:hypothetical protein
MTFNLVRWGFPNTVAILALAALPLAATLADRQAQATTARSEAAAIWPAAEHKMVAAAGVPEFMAE